MGLSNSVADISASMICPAVISMGMPRSGVGGRGGEPGGQAVRAASAPRVDSDTGEVGSETGILETEAEPLSGKLKILISEMVK